MKATVAIAGEAAGHAAAGPEAVGSRSPSTLLQIPDMLPSPAGNLRASHANPAPEGPARYGRAPLKVAVAARTLDRRPRRGHVRLPLTHGDGTPHRSGAPGPVDGGCSLLLD